MFSFLFPKDKLYKKQSSFLFLDLHKYIQDSTQKFIQNKIINESNQKNKFKKIFYDSSSYEINDIFYSDFNLDKFDKLDKLDKYNCCYQVNDASFYMYLFPFSFFLLSKYLGKQS
jgi:hypothetical protein